MSTVLRRRRTRPLQPRDQVFGQRAPGNSFLHRAPAGLKVTVLAAVALGVMIIREPQLNLAVLAAVIIVSAAARIPAGMLLTLLRRIWLLLAAMLAAQLAFNDLVTGLEVFSRVLAGLFSAHLLILSTTTHELLGVFRALLKPLRLLGVPTGKIVLAALVTLRAIPYLADQFYLAGQQARARGLERSIRARTVPVLLSAVAYARDTGRALCARGIEEIN